MAISCWIVLINHFNDNKVSLEFIDELDFLHFKFVSVWTETNFFAALTPGEQQICKSDEDCHRHNPDMVCVSHYGTVITKIVNGKMVTKRNLHETETGKCTLGKISQIFL